ncbi:MAG: hypothetical protein IKA31_05845 [Clostridia bacterium]|nr:hypothetical protein [Clostridia bacterium]
MELNQKTKFTTVKNEYYNAMLVTLDDALRNWDSFSRLDRLEYAYKCLELARNYTCSTRGVDPSKISCALEIMPSMGYCHAAKTKDGSTVVTTTLSIPEIMKKHNLSPLTILRAALHEETHACDEFLLDTKHYENAPSAEFSPGSEFIHPEYYQQLAQNYREFGIAWLGSLPEIRANEVGYGVAIDLLQDLSNLHPDTPFYQIHFNALKHQAEQQMARQYTAEVELTQWKAEMYQQYMPEGGYPIIGEEAILHEIEPPVHKFATIDTIRQVANQNEEMFKSPSYISTELQGLHTAADFESHPDICLQFKQTNITCINQIEQASPPTTTLSFMENASAMVLTLS